MRKMIVLSLVLLGATSCGYKQPVGEMCGNAGAASFSIPESEIYIWERGAVNPSPPGSTANISGAVLMLRWPGMEPRSGSNIGEFRKTYERSMGSTPWLAVSMYRSDTEFPKDQISRRLSHYLERLYAGKGGVSYRDDAYGLRHAVYQSPPGMLYEDLWFFWGGGDGAEHYIRCANALPDRPRGVLRRCENVFYMNELNMRVEIIYRDDKLVQWQEIQDRVRDHLLSKIKDCVAVRSS